MVLKGLFKNNIRVLLLASIIWNYGCQSIKKDQNAEDPEVANSVQNVAISLLNKGKPDMALKELNNYYISYKENGAILNLMGLTYLALKEPVKAEKFFISSIEVFDSPAKQLNLSSALIYQKNFKEALKVLGKMEPNIMESYSYPERVYHNLGIVHQKQKKLKKGIKYYQKALKYNQTFLPSLIKLAQIYYSYSSKPKKSFQFIERARGVCPECYIPLMLEVYYLRRFKGVKTAMAKITEFIEKNQKNSQNLKLASKLHEKISKQSEKK